MRKAGKKTAKQPGGPAPNFKAQLEQDLSCAFFNASEFCEYHDIDGDKRLVLVDNDSLSERQFKDYVENITLARLLFFIKKEDMGYMPRVGDYMRFDDEEFLVSDVSDDAGVLAITLAANREV